MGPDRGRGCRRLACWPHPLIRLFTDHSGHHRTGPSNCWLFIYIDNTWYVQNCKIHILFKHIHGLYLLTIQIWIKIDKAFFLPTQIDYLHFYSRMFFETHIHIILCSKKKWLHSQSLPLYIYKQHQVYIYQYRALV